MTIGEALRESKSRYEAGEREAAGIDGAQVAPSYSRGDSGVYVRWDPAWTYRLEADDMVADDWERNY